MLTLNLKISKNLEKSPQVNRILDYDYQDDDINVVIQELCEILEEKGIVSFQVSGFGQDDWPVDVASDLVSVLEQLPEVINSIYGGYYPFQLDFYEQGIQRRLEFEKNDNFIKITCYSGTSWIPNPSSVSLTEQDILSQLLNLKESFLQAVTQVNPELSESNLFDNWCGKSNYLE